MSTHRNVSKSPAGPAGVVIGSRVRFWTAVRAGGRIWRTHARARVDVIEVTRARVSFEAFDELRQVYIDRCPDCGHVMVANQRRGECPNHPQASRPAYRHYQALTSQQIRYREAWGWLTIDDR